MARMVMQFTEKGRKGGQTAPTFALPLHPGYPLGCCQRADTISAFMTVGIAFADEPTLNSQDELAEATSGSHNLRRRSNG
jgi:hypothetical protein